MKPKTSKALKWFKYLVIFYIVLNCILGLSTTLFASYLLIFRQEGLILKAKIIVLCFLIVPALLALLTTVVGWTSIKRRNVNLLKFFVAFLTITDTLQIAGCLWCFTSLPQIQEEVLVHMERKFSSVASDALSENWWNNVQTKLKCCGLHGPTDYSSTKAVPFSCCGSDLEDTSKGSCSFLWQKGCTFAVTKELSHDLILLGLVGLCFAFLQVLIWLLNFKTLRCQLPVETWISDVPGIFIARCFAKRLSKESI